MNDEMNRETIAISVKTAKLTAAVLKKLLQKYLEYLNNRKLNTHGKTTLKELVGDGAGTSSIEINEGNIKSFEKIAKKYNIDFAVKKDKTVNPPKYLVFFKGRDADVLSQAFKEYVYKNEKDKDRVSVREKLNKFKEQVQNKQRERQRDKSKRREESL